MTCSSQLITPIKFKATFVYMLVCFRLRTKPPQISNQTLPGHGPTSTRRRLTAVTSPSSIRHVSSACAGSTPSYLVRKNTLFRPNYRCPCLLGIQGQRRPAGKCDTRSSTSIAVTLKIHHYIHSICSVPCRATTVRTTGLVSTVLFQHWRPDHMRQCPR